MADVFLSYAHADRQKAQALADTLSRAGWGVFWDRVIRSGPRFRDVIAGELESAKCVVVLWSRESVQSDWVIDEAEEARSSGRLVPAVIDDVKPPHGFRGLQTANLVNWPAVDAGAEFDLLVSGIEAHAPRTRAGVSDTKSPLALPTQMPRGDSSPDTPQSDVSQLEELKGGDGPVTASTPAIPPDPVAPPESLAAGDNRPTPRAPKSVRGGEGQPDSLPARRSLADHGLRSVEQVDSESGSATTAAPEAPTRHIAEGGSGVPTMPPHRDIRLLAMAVGALLLAGVLVVVILNNSRVPRDLGFDASNVVMMEVTLPVARYKTMADVYEGFSALVDRVRAVPGVEAAAAVDVVPTGERHKNARLTIGSAAPITVRSSYIMGDYFGVLKMRPVLGRTLLEDSTGTLRDTVVSRSVTSDPAVLGRPAVVDIEESGAGSQGYVVVGVVGDIRSAGTRTNPEQHLYVRAALDSVLRMTILARLSNAGRLASATLALQQALATFDPELPAARVEDLGARVAATMSQPRFGTVTLALLALVALALVLLGSRGLMLYWSGRAPVA